MATGKQECPQGVLGWPGVTAEEAVVIEDEWGHQEDSWKSCLSSSVQEGGHSCPCSKEC
jgi:hypothetical protein